MLIQLLLLPIIATATATATVNTHTTTVRMPQPSRRPRVPPPPIAAFVANPLRRQARLTLALPARGRSIEGALVRRVCKFHE